MLAGFQRRSGPGALIDTAEEKKKFQSGGPASPQPRPPALTLSLQTTNKMVKRKLGALEKVEADLYVLFPL